jgi:uncharacterized protein YcbK (DUF882 family)
MTPSQRIKILENKLLTPENFSVKEYLNFGEYSVVSESDRLLILDEFEKQSTAKQQQNLSILWALQPYRTEIGIPMHITCGKRTYEHELRKGRSGNSAHLWGAIDFTCDNLNAYDNELSKTWVGGLKHYKNKLFIHADIGRNRRW